MISLPPSLLYILVVFSVLSVTFLVVVPSSGYTDQRREILTIMLETQPPETASAKTQHPTHAKTISFTHIWHTPHIPAWEYLSLAFSTSYDTPESEHSHLVGNHMAKEYSPRRSCAPLLLTSKQRLRLGQLIMNHSTMCMSSGDWNHALWYARSLQFGEDSFLVYMVQRRDKWR